MNKKHDYSSTSTLSYSREVAAYKWNFRVIVNHKPKTASFKKKKQDRPDPDPAFYGHPTYRLVK